MFIAAQHPAAVRITPSRGDGGIDILLEGEQTVVYQVKSFSNPLKPAQKKQVEKSIDALATDPRVAHLEVDEWHLVTPWDPTLEALEWLRTVVTSQNLPDPIWDGRVKFDVWASQYPEIVDYYFEGQRLWIQEQAQQLLEGLRLKELTAARTEPLTAMEVAEQLHQSAGLLNDRDPFYRYDVAVESVVGDPRTHLQQAMTADKPNLVASAAYGSQNFFVKVDVIAKTAMSVQLRPITGTAKVTVKPGSEEALALENFMKYGSPLTLPAGHVDVELDMPGGLGGELSGGSLIVYPAGGVSEQNSQIRLFTRDSNDELIASVVLNREYTSTGVPTDGRVDGLESLFRDSTGSLVVTSRFDSTSQGMSWQLGLDIPEGKVAVDVIEVLRLYASLQPPNEFGIAARFGPLPDTGISTEPSEREAKAASQWRDIAEAIAVIQEHTPLRLHFPRLEEENQTLITSILNTARVLSGETLTMSVSAVAFPHEPGEDRRAGRVIRALPAIVKFPEGPVDVGWQIIEFSGVPTTGPQGSGQGQMDYWLVEDGKMSIRAPRPREVAD